MYLLHFFSPHITNSKSESRNDHDARFALDSELHAVLNVKCFAVSKCAGSVLRYSAFAPM